MIPYSSRGGATLPILSRTILGLNTRYLDEGEGPAVLFLHGWGASFTVYTPLTAHLARTHRVLAPDLPGVGETDAPGRVWATADYVDFVRAFLEAVDVPITYLIGHSHGGRIILALMGGENPLPTVSRIALFASAGIKPRRPLRYYIKVYGYKTVKWLLTPLPGLRRKLMDRAGSADYRAASAVMKGTLSRVVREDFTPLLPNIGRPALLVWGDADTATPLYMANILEKNIPDAGLIVLPGGGHYAFLEQWGRVAPVLDAFFPV